LAAGNGQGLLEAAFRYVQLVFGGRGGRPHKRLFLWGLCIGRVVFVCGRIYADGGICTPYLIKYASRLMLICIR
jgi:hypothetical protein